MVRVTKSHFDSFYRSIFDQKPTEIVARELTCRPLGERRGNVNLSVLAKNTTTIGLVALAHNP